jgi:hypothetical protein
VRSMRAVARVTGRMERVRQLLRTRDEICSLAALYGDALANGRNDISTLRRAGWEIVCAYRLHEPGAPAHTHYRLVREGRRARPERVAKQMRLGVA